MSSGKNIFIDVCPFRVDNQCMRYLSVDLGASNGKVLAGELRDGKLCCETVYRFKNTMIRQDGFLCWDIPRIFSNILEGLKMAGKADYVSIECWGADFVLLDDSDQVVAPAVSYLDSRSDRVSIPYDPRELYFKTGVHNQKWNTVNQLVSIAEESPEILDRAGSLMFIPDYLNYLLTGVKATEKSIAYTSSLIDYKTGGWDLQLIDSLGIPVRLFSEISEPGRVLGIVSDAVAREIGYTPAVILSSSYEGSAAIYGAPGTDDALMLSVGGFSRIAMLCDDMLVSGAGCDGNFSNCPTYAGRNVFFKRIPALILIQRLKEEFKEGTSYDEIENLARKETEFPGIIDIFDLRLLQGGKISATVDEMLAEKSLGPCRSLEETAAVIYYSLASAYACEIARLEAVSGASFKEIDITGGGSRDMFLSSLIAMLTGRTVVAGPADAVAIGNLVIAMAATGSLNISGRRDVLRSSFCYTTYSRKED